MGAPNGQLARGGEAEPDGCNRVRGGSRASRLWGEDRCRTVERIASSTEGLWMKGLFYSEAIAQRLEAYCSH